MTRAREVDVQERGTKRKSFAIKDTMIRVEVWEMDLTDCYMVAGYQRNFILSLSNGRQNKPTRVV